MLSITATLTLIATQLRTAIGVFLVREARVQAPVWIGATLYAPRPDPARPPALPAALWSLFSRRLGRLAARFQALHDLWRQGRLPAPRPRAPAGPAPVARRQHHPAPAARLRLGQPPHPRGRPPAPAAWNPSSTTPKPASSPRPPPRPPACSAPSARPSASATPPWLRLPPRARKPRPPRPRAPGFAQALRDIPADRPLQPYVLAAARADHRKNGRRA